MSKGTVLYVDSYGPVRDTVSKVLEKAGYAVLVAECVEAAFPLMESAPIDVVVLEYTLCSHAHNGPSCTAKRVRELQPNAKIVVWTTGSNCAMLSPCADLKLLKPTPASELITHLDALLVPKTRAAGV